jgi:hypothetical protein
MKFFIDTSRFGGSIGATKLGDPLNPRTLAYKMGLGGYYDIIKVDHIFSNSDWSVDLTGKWVSPVREDPPGSDRVGKKSESNEEEIDEKPK